MTATKEVTRTDTRTHTHIHAYTNTHARTHARTHTYTHLGCNGLTESWLPHSPRGFHVHGEWYNSPPVLRHELWYLLGFLISQVVTKKETDGETRWESLERLIGIYWFPVQSGSYGIHAAASGESEFLVLPLGDVPQKWRDNSVFGGYVKTESQQTDDMPKSTARIHPLVHYRLPTIICWHRHTYIYPCNCSNEGTETLLQENSKIFTSILVLPVFIIFLGIKVIAQE